MCSSLGFRFAPKATELFRRHETTLRVDAVEKVGFPVDVMLLGGFSSARLAAISTQT
jgi:hypothetical protein